LTVTVFVPVNGTAVTVTPTPASLPQVGPQGEKPASATPTIPPQGTPAPVGGGLSAQTPVGSMPAVEETRQPEAVRLSDPNRPYEATPASGTAGQPGR
jgi:hypothetical protein